MKTFFSSEKQTKAPLPLIFARRNLIEMVRDPLIYLFCLAFPLVMLVLFSVIGKFAGDTLNMFTAATLLPGIMMFSATFIMLAAALLVSKDRSTAFLIRLFTSPLKTTHFVFGYFVPFFLAGIAQAIICLAAGAVIYAIAGEPYFSFGAAVLLMLEQMPFLLFCIFIGIAFGSLLSDKSAPAVTSVFISASGILGGAWLPLDTMGGFESFCRFLPFYPSVLLGRIVTGASHTPVNELPPESYTFDNLAICAIVCLLLYLAASVILAVWAFRRQMKNK
jgi:ABC-2 type transport system permease protein